MIIRPPEKVELRQIEGKGMGVFSIAPIAKGETIEVCPARPITNAEAEAVDKIAKTITQYYFIWDEEDPEACGAIVFGYGSIYNHSSTPNIDCEKDFENRLMRFFSMEDIPVGTELCFDYDVELWFKPV